MFSPQLGLGLWGDNDSAELSFNYSDGDGQQSFDLLFSQPGRSLEIQDLMQSVPNKKQKISPTINTSNFNFQFLESNEQQVEIETSNEVEPAASAFVVAAGLYLPGAGDGPEVVLGGEPQLHLQGGRDLQQLRQEGGIVAWAVPNFNPKVDTPNRRNKVIHINQTQLE